MTQKECLDKIEEIREHIYKNRVGDYWKEPYVDLEHVRNYIKELNFYIDSFSERLKEADSFGFMSGIAWCAALHAEFGGCNTEEFFHEAGYTWEDFVEAGVNEYDLRRIAVGIGQCGVKSIRRKKEK